MNYSTDVSTMLHTGAQGIFFILLIIFTLHAVFLAYHWFTYGDSKHISMLALATYLGGGALLLLTFSFAIRAI